MTQFQGDNQASSKKRILIFIGIFLVFVLAIVLVFITIKMVNDTKARNLAIKAEAAVNKEKASSTLDEATKLANSLLLAEEAKKNASSTVTSEQVWQAQNFYFGDFYKVDKDNFVPKIEDYALPLNIKTDVENYRDFSRSINLDSSLLSLNKDGSAVLDNPFSKEADNFYSMYSTLDAHGAPSLITSDFLVYYYQNTMKSVFKDIESSVFYNNLWEINKSLYQTAKDRYEKNLTIKDSISDLTLESSRLEMVYFATALYLLAPAPDQINKGNELEKNNLFSSEEASQFSFQLPEYLKTEVEAEVALIKDGKGFVKSPVLLYDRDYAQFIVPENYKANARLNNFYLASRWLNSVFPLYYRNSSCQDCLLDKDDWEINMTAALLLSEDLSANQDLQNRWAKIYKIMGFFQGLRGDLNYLFYKEALTETFGKDKTVADILNNDEKTVSDNLIKLQEKLASFNFPIIKGGLDRTNPNNKHLLGLRLLTEAYWPNDYISSQLIYPNVGARIKNTKEADNNSVACQIKQEVQPVRCFCSSSDILNSIGEFSGLVDQNFSRNAAFKNYDNQITALRQDFSSLSEKDRHDSAFWATMDSLDKLLLAPVEERTIFMKTQAWNKKDLNTAAATWTDLQLPGDILIPLQASNSRLSQIESSGQVEAFSYLEPDLSLVKELGANTKMVSDMLTLLNINEVNKTTLTNLNEMNDVFVTAEAIVKKELSGETLSQENYNFLSDFKNKFSVKEAGSKVLKFSSSFSKDNLVEKISGVKLLVVIFKSGDKKFLVAGPIFNYIESRE